MTAIILIGIWYSKIRKVTTNEISFASSAVDGIDTGVSMPQDSAFSDEEI
jgi:hypothetical protein